MDSQYNDSEDIASRFNEGINKFNEGDFFECHDILEDIWFEIRGSSRNFYQGLIHIAVGFYHITVRKNPKGALSQLNKGILKLNDYKPEFQGVKLNNLLSKIGSCISVIEEINDHTRKDFPAKLIPKIIFDKNKYI